MAAVNGCHKIYSVAKWRNLDPWLNWIETRNVDLVNGFGNLYIVYILYL